MKGALALLGCLILAGCSDGPAEVETTDPSTLSQELEAEAKGIEARAAAAVREAEALADRELQEMQEAARAADSAENDAGAGDSAAVDPPAK